MPADPYKLTQPVHDTIVRALASGCYRATAAEHAGVGTSTFYRWLEQGEADLENDKRTTKCAELVVAIRKAEADAEVAAAALIRNAAPKNWQAAAWLLERKHPERWGRRDAVKVEHSGRIGHDVTGMSTEELERLADQLAD